MANLLVFKAPSLAWTGLQGHSEGATNMTGIAASGLARSRRQRLSQKEAAAEMHRRQKGQWRLCGFTGSSP